MAAPVEWTRGAWTVSTDRARLDRELTARTLAGVYWSPGIPREVVEGAIEHSLCFGLYREGAGQVGFARFVTDYYTFAYLCDVFVLESERGQGAGKFLMECVMAYPGLDRLRRLMLVTRDAHELYRQFGFAELANPGRWMEIFDPGAATIQGRSHERAACAINPDSRGGRRE